MLKSKFAVKVQKISRIIVSGKLMGVKAILDTIS
jgi:hypothetical protein